MKRFKLKLIWNGHLWELVRNSPDSRIGQFCVNHTVGNLKVKEFQNYALNIIQRSTAETANFRLVHRSVNVWDWENLKTHVGGYFGGYETDTFIDETFGTEGTEIFLKVTVTKLKK